MQHMMVLSLLLNIVVLVPVCWGIIHDAHWVRTSYGEVSPAQNILLSVYLSIGILSAALLIFRDPKLIAALLIIQIIYKMISPLTVGTIGHPVVMSNIFIALFHSVTLFLIWRSI